MCTLLKLHAYRESKVSSIKNVRKILAKIDPSPPSSALAQSLPHPLRTSAPGLRHKMTAMPLGAHPARYRVHVLTVRCRRLSASATLELCHGSGEESRLPHLQFQR